MFILFQVNSNGIEFVDIGCVVGGVLMSGRLSANGNQIYYIGPDRGKFTPVRITSIHRQRCPVHHLQAGQAGTLALTFEEEEQSRKRSCLDKDKTPSPRQSELSSDSPERKLPHNFRIRRGQMILSAPHRSSSHAKVTRDFDAEIRILCHDSLLTTMQQGTVFCGSVRQSARVMHIYPSESPSPVEEPSSPILKAGLKMGETGKVRLRFANEAEWIQVGWTVLFREGRMKCVGKIVAVAPHRTSVIK
jgi:GTPase